MTSRIVVRAGFVGTVLALAAGACSLGLDESLITADAGTPLPTDDARADDGNVGDGRPPTTTDGGDAAPGSFRIDSECRGTGCVVGRCDLAAARCVYEVCPQADPCKGSRCDATTNTCQPAVTFPLHEEFPLAEPVNQAGPFRPIAMIPPYVFLNTGAGVVAFNYREPGQPKTAKPIVGAPFQPAFLFSSGRRLYLVGGPVGSAQRKLPVAWLDVSDDARAELRAESGYVPYAGTSIAFAMPFGVDEAAFGHQNPSPAFAIGKPPFTAAISPSPTATTQNYIQFAASGDRLVAIRSFYSSSAPGLSLLTGLGTTSPTFGPEANLSPGAQYTFQGGSQLATSRTGATVMSWPLWTNVLPFSGNVQAVRLAFILDDDKDTTFSATDFVDVTTFPPPGVPMYANMAGPMAFSDDRTVFATFAAASSPTARVAAGFFTRGGADAGASDAGTNSLTDFPMSPGSLYGVAAAPGIGAIVGNSGTTLHYVRQGCTP